MTFTTKAAAAFAVLTLCACQADRAALSQLERMQSLKDARLAAREQVDCASSSPVCVRLLQEHGAACLQLAESASPAVRAAMRDCAVHDFAAARAQAPANLPPDSRLRSAQGLAQALVIDRDNSMDPARRAADQAGIERVAEEMHALPGGADAAAYYAANSVLNRVLTVPDDRACAALAAARTSLDGAKGGGDLAGRIAELRQQIETAMHIPGRSCG